MRRVIFIVVVVGVALCNVPPIAGASESGSPAPKGLPAFYSVPAKWPSTRPGTLLKFERVSVSGLDGTAYRVMYVSQGDGGKPVPVTGYVVVPATTAPAGGWPVVAWSHGTDGMADMCAPSLSIGHSDLSAADINQFLERGWAFAASDYQGEGTPGLLPYIVGASAAEDTVNVVRAAHHVPGAHTSSNWVDWGHSEGGQTAMFVDNIGAGYGSDLHLKGVVAGAPPSQFSLIYSFLKTSPYAYYLLMVAAGYNAYYGDAAAPLNAILTPKAVSLLTALRTSCTSKIAAEVAPYVASKDFTSLEKVDPFMNKEWKKLLVQNDPGQFTKSSVTPLLIIHGGADEQIPTVSSQVLYTQLCKLGQDVSRWVYPGQSHAGVIAVSANDMLEWIADRFAGDPTPDPMTPKGTAQSVPTTQSCN